jgi:membrane-bound metal-dependent hydrolase YbcI (DUF457 family)
MILWHLGITLLVVRYVFRDPDMDLRWVALGSVLPDIIDKPIGSVFFHGTFGTHRLFAHSLLFPVLVLAVVLAVTKRESGARRALMAVVIGAMFHLVLDAAWADPKAFWWPLLGFEFPEIADSAILPLLRAQVTNPMVWLGEAAGLAYLVYLWVRWVPSAGGMRAVLSTGRIPLPPARR